MLWMEKYTCKSLGGGKNIGDVLIIRYIYGEGVHLAGAAIQYIHYQPHRWDESARGGG